MTKDEAREAWYAGFYEAGEGWNGEYPFGQHDDPKDHKRLREQFESWWRSLGAKQ